MKVHPVSQLPTPRVFPLNILLFRGTCTLVCAEDQAWINVYKQGMNITKLISEGHIDTSPDVNERYLFV